MIPIYFTIAILTGGLLSFYIQKKLIALVSKNSLYCRQDQRGVNKTPKPRLGGVGIFLGFIISFYLVLFISHLLVDEIYLKINFLNLNFYILSLIIIFIVGLLDDLVGLNAWQKLPLEILAAIILYFNGFAIKLISFPVGTEKIELSGIIAFILTLVWIVGITNSMNLIDGIDGLAGGVAFFATISFTLMSLINKKPEFSILAVGLIGSLIAFLYYNIHPSKIFMGDSGSLFLGFFLSTISLKAATKASFSISFIIPIIVLFLPILDTFLAILRRIINRMNPFQADSQHIHHKLLTRGFNERRVFLILMVFTGLLSAMGIVSLFLNRTLRLIFLLVILMIGVICMIYLRYIRLDVFLRKRKKEERM